MASAKILIVEDEFIIAMALEESLKAQGYAVADRVSSGEQAIEAAVRLSPDLVLMDIQLRGMLDGVQAAQRIQTALRIPVVYLTAHSDQNTLKRVVHSQPYGYITKPVTDEGLKEAIDKALTLHQKKTDSLNGTPPF